MSNMEPDLRYFEFATDFKCCGHAYVRDRARATLLVLPALGVIADKYRRFAEACVARGYNVLIGDYPGNGNSTPRPSRTRDYGYQHLLTDFIPSLQRLASEFRPDIPCVLVGHSVGGHVATLYSQWQDAQPCPIISIASGTIHYSNWDGVGRLGILMAASIINLSVRLIGHFPGVHVGFGRHEAQTLMRQWSKVARTGDYRHIPFQRSDDHRRSFQGLYIGIDADPFSPPRSTEALAKCFRGQTTIIRIGLPTGVSGNPHGAWLKAPDAVVAAIDRWLTDDLRVNVMND